MAEGFSPVDYITGIRLSELQGKKLWLVRVPRHIDASRLEGVKTKVPRKGRAGKVLGRVTTNRKDCDNGDGSDHERDGGMFGEGLVLRAADPAETCGFRALVTTEDGALGAAGPFAGQINVSVEATSDLQANGEDEAPPAAASESALIEPYRGRPQLTGMRVRSKPAGAGSEYTSKQRGHQRRHQGVAGGVDCGEPLATPDQGKKKKSKKTKPSASNSSLSYGDAKTIQDSLTPEATTSPKKKKKKRKSTSGVGGAAEEDVEEGGGATTNTSKRKKLVER